MTWRSGIVSTHHYPLAEDDCADLPDIRVIAVPTDPPRRCAYVLREFENGENADTATDIESVTTGGGHNPPGMDKVNEYAGPIIFNLVDNWIKRRLAFDGVCTDD